MEIILHPLMRKVTIFVGITALFLMSAGRLAADDGLQQSFIESSALPAIHAIIQSLEAQNAPVPAELPALIHAQDDADEFYLLAERYFGPNWQARLAREAESLKDPAQALIVRMRMYLSSLVLHAEQISTLSPIDTEGIRGKAQNLLRQSQNIASEGDREQFFADFAAAYEAIFPEENEQTLDTFRADVPLLLADAADAIGILTRGRYTTKLTGELADLQSRLQLVAGSQELTAWLAKFDAFADTLLSHATHGTDPQILRDIRALLTNLSTYLATIHEQEIDPGQTEERVDELLERVEGSFTPEELEEFYRDVEHLLTNITLE